MTWFTFSSLLLAILIHFATSPLFLAASKSSSPKRRFYLLRRTPWQKVLVALLPWHRPAEGLGIKVRGVFSTTHALTHVGNRQDLVANSLLHPKHSALKVCLPRYSSRLTQSL